ncbi:cupin domain-containing protein [Novosphingobium resinovorum]|uniref:Cupin n=1 Tax=Novosphingobium resinovorum TaxID=158500 RepID=A0A1D8ADV4_9SPHN|nr:cupin domain-containing protein [Novosphingobium resinovorum]AOR80302.1 cupin [Novosphingobium resinovorum]
MKIQSFILTENGWVPNNARLPVVNYSAALDSDEPYLADRFEALFGGHGWPADWRDGIFDYRHYHSTAHEVLGVFSGSATLEIGGPHGRRIEVLAGDALMLPAGTGHRCLSANEDFKVVGAYPQGQDWDICREAADDATRARIAALPDPPYDPVTGERGARTGP